MQANNNKIKGIAARAGRWSATHRKAAILGWFAFVIVAFAVGSSVGSKSLTDIDYFTGESKRAEQTLVDADMKPPASETVLVQSKRLTVEDPQFKAALADVSRRVSKLDVVEHVDPRGGVSKDRHSALVQFDIRGDADKAVDKIDPVLDEVAAARRANPKLRIEQVGDASIEKELEGVFEKDLQKAETLSLPVTLLILLIAFGALAAAGLPILLALSAVLATVGLVALPSHVLPISDASASVILLIGMAVGVDYSLFYMRREREERAKGYDAPTALQRAAATSGRAVLVSGLTVMTAMAGMFLSGDKEFTGMGLGAMIVVGVAMIASLTFLPAMLSWLGDRVEKGRVPYVTRRRARNRGESRMWTAVVDGVLRRPAVSAIVATGALVALTIPAFGMKTKVTGASDVPQDMAVVQAYNHIDKEFPGKNMPAVVVVEDGNVRAGGVARAIAEMKQKAVASGEFFDPITTLYSKDGTVAKVEIPMAGDGADDESKAALSSLRDDIVPATVGNLPGTDVNVTGTTAETVDQSNQLSHAMPIVFGFVLVMAFLVLLLTFRSIVIPIKAIVLNLLSVGAAYGVLTLVFQEGHGTGLVGAEPTGGIASWLPLFIFVVLFGLSMDYHVFILSRIREAFDGGMRTEDAVAHGIKSTAGVVTSAAFVMIAVFGIFATLSFVDFKQLGVGLAVAVLIDATIVRAVLLPATMKLLGDWNWYLPKSLRWLPQVKHEGSVEPARA
jgi:uncharacterized membrane protein YdfJ with MMPL/SSD domain